MSTALQTPLSPPARPAFGTVLAPYMSHSLYKDGTWSPAKTAPVGPITLHPAAHVLHYASSCFEGFKAYRWKDGSTHVFRMDRHIERMRQSARELVLPEPDAQQLEQMIRSTIDANRKEVPEAPGALYLRPILFGTTPNIGAASIPASDTMLIVLASPVWDYFAGGAKPLRIYVETHASRTSSATGCVKTGGNYAAALGPTLAARRRHQADQVLFAPGGEVQETGAANFLLFRDRKLRTRSLDGTFLHGVTRDSILTLARDADWDVQERIFTVDELFDWATDGEAALSGTAAVLAGVGVLVHQDVEHRVGTGEIGMATQEFRQRLIDIQRGEAEDRHRWLANV